MIVFLWNVYIHNAVSFFGFTEDGEYETGYICVFLCFCCHEIKVVFL